MAAITDVTIGATATSIITAAMWKTLGGPVYLKNESDEVITLTISGADTMELDPGEPQHVLPGQVVTGTAVGGAALLQIYQGIIPDSESAAKAIAAAALPANLIGTIVVVSATGAAAIAATTASTKRFRLISVTCHLDAGPTTSENFSVTVDALDGADYDTTLYSVDPSLLPATDLKFIPDGDDIYEAGDQIIVDYTNTDTATYGLRITIEEF
jgi:hypothetical protein